MIDFVAIFTLGGVVVFEARLALGPTPASIRALLNAAITECLIPGRPVHHLTRDTCTLAWRVCAHTRLVVAAGTPTAAHVTYVPALLDTLATHVTLPPVPADVAWVADVQQCLVDTIQALETAEATAKQRKGPSAPEAVDAGPAARTVRGAGRPTRGKRGAKAGGSAKENVKPNQKAPRKWDDTPLTKEEMAGLDYSLVDTASTPSTTTSDTTSATASTTTTAAALSQASSSSLLLPTSASSHSMNRSSSTISCPSPATPRSIFPWKQSKDPVYHPAAHKVSSAAADSTTATPNRFTQFIERTFSTTRTLTVKDLAPLLATLQSALLAKNVASEVTHALLQAVEGALVGQIIGWQSVRTQVHRTVETLCTRWLLPAAAEPALLHTLVHHASPPYVFVVCGVNGVGKSTQVAKLAYWLLANQVSVLLAACDTFRSGAIEQLRTHAQRLASFGRVELFASEYGRDAAHLARDAIQYARTHQFQVVFIDTAGRMQDNEPLMRALAKLVAMNQPDRILFVGEATVGNTSLDQLTKFNQALRNFAPRGTSSTREIDALILTKFDLIGNQVGAAINMTYKSGKPILFVGTGQQYTDLKRVDVPSIVKALLS